MSVQDTPQVAANNSGDAAQSDWQRRQQACASLLATHQDQLAERDAMFARLENDALVATLGRPAEELAVALYMSDMPDRRPKDDTWTLVQLAAWVNGGTETVGTSGVWLTAYWSQQHSKAGNWAEYRHFWGDPRREKTARQAAAQITSSSTYNYQPTLVQVVIASCDAGHEWTIDLDARDVRFAARRGVVLR